LADILCALRVSAVSVHRTGKRHPNDAVVHFVFRRGPSDRSKNNDGVSMEKISARHLLSGFVCLLPLHDGYSESTRCAAAGGSIVRR